MVVNFIQLKSFMAVMDQRNMTKAAKVVFTTQSNISKQIAQLEDELEIQFFDRSTSGVYPTSAAEYFYEKLKDLLPQIENLFVEVKQLHNQKRGIVRLGVCESMAIERVSPGLLKEFGKAYPSIEVQIESNSVERVLEHFTTGMLDIVFLFSIIRADIPGTERIELSRSKPVLYFSKFHPLYQKPDLCLEDFMNETFIRYDSKNMLFDQNSILPFTPKQILGVNSLNSAFVYVESGVAVAVLGKSQLFLGKKHFRTPKGPKTRNRTPDLQFQADCWCLSGV